MTARYWLEDRVAIQAIAGWRVLGNQTLDLPGPLVTADWTYHLLLLRRPVRLTAYAGYGGGAGWMRAGCHLDSVAEVCVDETAPSFVLRLPLGIDLSFAGRKLEVGFEAVPAIRVAPETHHTFLGGLAVRWYGFSP